MTRLEGLYAVTPDWNETSRLLAVTEAILRGGCRILQYRHKATNPCHRDEQAGALRNLTRQFGAALIINDDVDLALAVEADGVHLGMEDGDLTAARARLGHTRILGASCYQDLERARQAVALGASYVAFGSFFPSPTKPQAVRAGLHLLAEASALGVPVAAIGGITRQNAGGLIRAGADMVAIISDLYAAGDPEQAARDIIHLFPRNTRP
jgi:thiamine-phosphate pyrophosphorylase